MYLADGEKATDQQLWYTKQLLEGMIGPSEYHPNNRFDTAREGPGPSLASRRPVQASRRFPR